MPWDHCDVEFILDDEPCPRCGVAKGAWTVQVEQTRTLRIGRKKPRARWGAKVAHVGDRVQLLVEHVALPRDAIVRLEVFEHDHPGPGALPDDRSRDDLVCEVQGEVRGDTVVGVWTCVHVDDDDDEWANRYTLVPSPGPELYFVAHLPDGALVCSGTGEETLLRLRDRVDETFLDPQGQPIAEVECEVYLADGEVRPARTDALGRLRLEDVPLGGYSVRLVLAQPYPEEELDTLSREW